MIIHAGHLYRPASGSRVLYHIGPRAPKPEARHWDKFSQDWYGPSKPGYERPWLKENPGKVVFLTPQPALVWMNHSRKGNLYAFSVPEWVIEKAGGIHEWDSAPEVLIPEDLWHHVKLLGKKYDEAAFEKKMFQEYHFRIDRYKVDLTDEEIEDVEKTLQQHNRKKKREKKLRSL